jgi:hypothetical protein
MRQQLVATVSLLGLLALVAPASAIINPRFTPTDLVRGASQVLVLRVTAPDATGADAELVETLKGAPPAKTRLRLTPAPDGEVTIADLAAAFGTHKTSPAVVVLTPDGGDGPLTGAIQIETLWFSLSEQDGKWLMDRDKADMFSVWAGGARQLAEAARYVIADPGAGFPVKSAITWDADVQLGALAGPSGGCLVADLGAPVARCVLVLCDAGDRAIAVGKDGNPPTDVTARLGLTTRSRRAAVADVNGDGRMDLVYWDGRNVGTCLRKADGTFAAPVTHAPLTACCSLDVVNAGGQVAVLAGTPTGPVLLAPVGPGMKASELPGASVARDLGAGGVCATADVNADGKTDVLQCFTKGVLYFAGGAGGVFQPAVRVAVGLPRNPALAVWGDYDMDGRLDLMVGGADGLAMLIQSAPGRWEAVNYVTGELAYHGNANAPDVVAGGPCDINNDGRQGVALFYRDRPCMQFFNRGFGCFGLARELSLTGGAEAGDAPPDGAPPKEPLKAAGALQRGQQSGTMLDLNGDGTQDLLAADVDGALWVLFSTGEFGRAPSLTIQAPPGARGLITVTVSSRKRVWGMYVVRPGAPATLCREMAGPVTLNWADADGVPRTKTLIVTGAHEFVVAPGG